MECNPGCPTDTNACTLGQVSGTSPRTKVRSDAALPVYDLVVKGYSNEEIAGALGLTVRTVKYHISGILGSTGTNNRIELIAAHGRAANAGRNPEGLRSRIETERQAAVYDLLVTGHTGPDVAKRLGITPRTVKFHSQALLEQTGMPTQARLVASHWSTAATARASRGSATEGALRAIEGALEQARAERDRVSEMLEALTSALAVLE